MTATTPALRVAIVGAGPRGLFALERLTSHAARHGVALTVDVYDPTSAPGAGPVYDPRQAAYLRMNLTAEHVDAWWPDDGAVPTPLRRSLVDWLADADDAAGPHARAVAEADEAAKALDPPRVDVDAATNALDPPPVASACDGHASPGDAYVPRAVVGRYLHEAFGLVTRFAPPQVRLRVRRHAVGSLVPDGDRWQVDANGEQRSYHEVLVAGGHRETDQRSLARTWSHAAPLVPAVFPVDRWLTAERVPAGSAVALRGLALTAIDAILALTEGRGGRFVVASTSTGLRYVPGPGRPVVILPYSRSGRPMRPKPDAAIFGPIAERVAGVVATATARLPREPSGADAVAVLARVVGDVAAAVLAAGKIGAAVDGTGVSANGTGAAANDTVATADERRRLVAWTTALAGGGAGPSDRTPHDELRQGYAAATGAVPLDAEAALGIAWRLVYPAVVDRFGGAALGEDGWRVFRSLAAELERVGFGPSPENVAKLLALVEAGHVALDHAVGGRLVDRGGTTELRSAAGAVAVDRVIDGVLPGPGIDRSGTAPLDRLLDAGRVAVAPGQRGVRVDPVDAAALDRTGRRIAGLSAIGRDTEDATVGNDTLNRALHPQVDRWAARVVARAAFRRSGDERGRASGPGRANEPGRASLPDRADEPPEASAPFAAQPVAVGEDGQR